jgi:hypothetical protein
VLPCLMVPRISPSQSLSLRLLATYRCMPTTYRAGGPLPDHSAAAENGSKGVAKERHGIPKGALANTDVRTKDDFWFVRKVKRERPSAQ